MMTCDQCGGEVAVVLPGDEEERNFLGLERRGTPARCFCLEHAITAGCFVYPSERQPKPRKAAPP